MMESVEMEAVSKEVVGFESDEGILEIVVWKDVSCLKSIVLIEDTKVVVCVKFR